MDHHTWKHETVTLQASLRQWVQEQVEPQAAHWDQQEHIPSSIFQQLAPLGIFGLQIPQSLGGAGLGIQATMMVLEEIAKGDGGLALMLAAHNILLLGHLKRYGSPEQQHVIPSLARGEKLGAWALSEPEHGSDSGQLSCSATQEGHTWRLQGSKTWVTLGHLADVILVFARTDQAKGPHGISAFLIPASTPGLTSKPMAQKLGMRSADLAHLFIDQISVSESTRIGTLHQSWQEAGPILDTCRLAVAAIALGLGIAALQHTRTHVRQRKQFQQSLIQMPVIGHRLADMAMGLAAAREMVQTAAALADQGQPFRQQAAMAKLLATQAACQTAQQAVYLHGGQGLLSEHAVGRIWRDAQLCTVVGGTDDMQRLVLREHLLGSQSPI